MKNNYQRKQIKELAIMIMTITTKDIPVLVKCHGGMDRSPFIVACYLAFEKWMENAKWRGLECYDEVKCLHPATVTHDDWMRWWLQE